jgi:hypothetical protein
MLRISITVRTLLCALCVFAGVSSPAFARDRVAVSRFRKDNPCPSSGQVRGPCAGYVVDHTIPLCLGGADDPSNMKWQEKQESLIKDQLERQACAAAKRRQGNGLEHKYRVLMA